MAGPESGATAKRPAKVEPPMNDQPFSSSVLKRYAQLLVSMLCHIRKKPFRRQEYVQIRFEKPAFALAEETALCLQENSLTPVFRLLPAPPVERMAYLLTPKSRLGRPLPGEREFLEGLGGTISLFAPVRFGHLQGIDEERLALFRRNRAPLSSILRARESAGLYAWTLCLWPTIALAQASGMSLFEYAGQVRKACLLDRGDPMSAWLALMQRARRIARWLTGLGDCQVHVESASTDLRFRVGRLRKWVGISGRNLPSFEVYVSPDWRSVDGIYCATMPSSQGGERVEGLRLRYCRGRLVSLEAEEGEAIARGLALTDRGASRIGEFALVDRRLSPIDRYMNCTLYDENFGGPFGSMHIALGQSYANTFSGSPGEMRAAELGFSRSAVHWDLVSTEDRRVTVTTSEGSRRVIYENGEFALA